ESEIDRWLKGCALVTVIANQQLGLMKVNFSAQGRLEQASRSGLFLLQERTLWIAVRRGPPVPWPQLRQLITPSGHDLRIQPGDQSRSLNVVITEPAWRVWSTLQFFRIGGFYLVRFILLLLAICVGFSRPEQPRARLLALMFAIGAVAEGYPSPG